MWSKLASLVGIALCAVVSTAATVDRSNITVAGVVAPPPHWPLPIGNKNWTGITLSLSDSVNYAAQLISEASSNGADLIAFPELWIPAYPKGYDLNNWVVEHIDDYSANSLVVGSPEWDVIVNATRLAGIHVALAFSERIDDNIYMGQTLLGPNGTTLLHRQKLRPTGSERDIFSDGYVDGLAVVNTSIGRISMLQCWEHLKPGMTFDVMAQQPNIHVGPWPYNQNVNTNGSAWWESADIALSAQRVLTIMSGATSVMPSVGFGAVISPLGQLIGQSDSNELAGYNVSSGHSGLVYGSVNGSSWEEGTGDPDSEFSWDILGQMKQGYAKLLPTTNGKYVAHRNTSIASLRQYAQSNGTTNLTSTPFAESDSSPTKLSLTSGTSAGFHTAGFSLLFAGMMGVVSVAVEIVI